MSTHSTYTLILFSRKNYNNTKILFNTYTYACVNKKSINYK